MLDTCLKENILCRRGVAQALVRACEGVAAAANFWDIYIQAATTMRDSRSPLGGWLSEEYKVCKWTPCASVGCGLGPLWLSGVVNVKIISRELAVS
jgi:hypothetical protein